jgi:preprotein translocase subunit SecB
MADQSGKTGNGDGAGAHEGGPPIQAAVVGQYIKDLSFENPNVGRLIDGPGDQPNLKLEINVNGTKMPQGNDLYESAIDFSALAANKAGTIYELQVVYAGLFKIQNIPEQALEPFLLINCPTIIFPFLRRLVADISREGGFPPLLLDPIDFGGLYVRRRQEMAQQMSGRA